MTDLFICTCATVDDPIRWHLFQAVSARWSQERDLRVRILSPVEETVKLLAGTDPNKSAGLVDCSLLQFQLYRRIVAEQLAESNPYIVCDDDCMPLGKDFVRRGLQLMEQYPDYGTISARIVPETESMRLRIEKAYPPFFDYEVYDGATCGLTSGGINFTRKGILGDVLAKKDPNVLCDDCGQTQALREAGWKVGIAREIYQNHLGSTISTIWPAHYAGKGTQINEYV